MLGQLLFYVYFSTLLSTKISHGESNVNTLPTPSSCLDGSTSVGVHDESDGKDMKHKLKVGFKNYECVDCLIVLPTKKMHPRQLLIWVLNRRETSYCTHSILKQSS